MASTSAPANERLAKRIKQALPSVSDPFAAEKLRYIAKQITPSGMERRGEDDQDVTHLHEVAKSVLKNSSKETRTND